MAYKLQIVEDKQGLNFNVKYQNLSRYKRPDVEAREPGGKVVKERTTYQGKVLGPGATQRQWVDDAGNVYAKSSLKFYYNGDEVPENSQTKVFHIDGYQPLSNYTDNYVISTYYETFPHNNDMKKDFDKESAIQTNLAGMKKLFDYLDQNKLVARGEFCPSSKGFMASDGYLRAVRFGNKWGIELAVFKEEKIFEHLQEDVPVKAPAKKAPIKKLKMV